MPTWRSWCDKSARLRAPAATQAGLTFAFRSVGVVVARQNAVERPRRLTGGDRTASASVRADSHAGARRRHCRDDLAVLLRPRGAPTAPGRWSRLLDRHLTVRSANPRTVPFYERHASLPALRAAVRTTPDVVAGKRRSCISCRRGTGRASNRCIGKRNGRLKAALHLRGATGPALLSA